MGTRPPIRNDARGCPHAGRIGFQKGHNPDGKKEKMNFLPDGCLVVISLYGVQAVEGQNMRICSGPGCMAKVSDGVRFCDDCRPTGRRGDGIKSHVPAEAAVASRDKYAHLYQSSDWTKCAKLQLKRYPFCERCKKAMATICDHFIPAEVFIELCREPKRFLTPERGFFWAGNHQSLCRACHHAKTLEDKSHTGPWPDLFSNPRREPKKWAL